MATVVSRVKGGTGVTTETADHGTKSEFLKNPKQGQIPAFPGDFELQKLIFTSPHRKGYVDLKAAWSDFNIYESLFSPYLTADIQIVDGVGLLESAPIIGEETIQIQVKTKGIVRQRTPDGNAPGPFEGSQNEGRINLQFRVVKIGRVTKLNDQMLTYKLTLVSEEAIINLKQKVKKSALDSQSFEPRKISDVVKSLYRQFFQRGRSKSKKIFIEPTKNLTDLIIPNQTPFKAFNFLASRAVSAGKHAVGSSFVFYETIRGFFFISMETLMAGGGLGYGTVAGAPGSPQELVYTKSENPVKETYVIQPKRLGAQTNELKNVAARQILGAIGSIIPGTQGLEEVAGMATGQIIADRMELAFKGLPKRGFQYTFKMIPKSEQEAEEIRKIVFTFKANMLPEIKEGTAGRGMVVPNTFDIRYMYMNRDNDFLHKISTCVLESMNVTYGGDRYRTFPDAGDGTPPVETTMTLNFKELELITKERVYEGF